MGCGSPCGVLGAGAVCCASPARLWCGGVCAAAVQAGGLPGCSHLEEAGGGAGHRHPLLQIHHAGHEGQPGPPPPLLRPSCPTSPGSAHQMLSRSTLGKCWIAISALYAEILGSVHGFACKAVMTVRRAAMSQFGRAWRAGAGGGKVRAVRGGHAAAAGRSVHPARHLRPHPRWRPRRCPPAAASPRPPTALPHSRGGRPAAPRPRRAALHAGGRCSASVLPGPTLAPRSRPRTNTRGRTQRTGWAHITSSDRRQHPVVGRGTRR